MAGYHPKSLQCLSVLQIIVGSISMLLGIASVVLITDFMSVVGFGIWVGIWIITAGLLGFLGSRNPQVPHKCLLGTFMGLTITACVFAIAMLISYSIALAALGHCLRDRTLWHEYDTNYYYLDYCPRIGFRITTSSIKAGIGIDIVLLLISILEFVVGLASSIYCCNAMCSCCNRNYQGIPQVVYHQQPPAGQQIIRQPGQPTVVPVSQPGSIPMQQDMTSPTHPPPIVGGVTTGGQTAQTEPHKNQDAPPANT